MPMRFEEIPPPPPADHRLAYGPEPDQFADLRLPAGPGPHPVAILLHGGYWRRRFDLLYMGALAADLAQRDVATWNLEYRRVGQPGGGWPGTLEDVAAGADALRVAALTFPLDLTRVVTLGHSAGGQLALWLAARARLPAGDTLRGANPLAVRGVVALAAVSDLRLADQLRLSADATAALLGGGRDAVPERYDRASPAALLPLGVPQILAHGTQDDAVPFALSQRYVAAATAVGDDARLLAFNGVGHFELVAPRTPAGEAVTRATLVLLGP